MENKSVLLKIEVATKATKQDDGNYEMKISEGANLKSVLDGIRAHSPQSDTISNLSSHPATMKEVK